MITGFRIAGLLIASIGAYFAAKYDFHKDGKTTREGKKAIFLILMGLLTGIIVEIHTVIHEKDDRDAIIKRLNEASGNLATQVDKSAYTIDTLTNSVKKKTQGISDSLITQSEHLLKLKIAIAEQIKILRETKKSSKAIGENLTYLNGRIFTSIRKYDSEIEIIIDHIDLRYPEIYKFMLDNQNRKGYSNIPVFSPVSIEGSEITDSLFKPTSDGFNYALYISGGDSPHDELGMICSSYTHEKQPLASIPKIKYVPDFINKTIRVTIEHPYIEIEHSPTVLLSEVDYEKFKKDYTARIEIWKSTFDQCKDCDAPIIWQFSFTTFSDHGSKIKLINLNDDKTALSGLNKMDGSRVYDVPLDNMIRNFR